MLLSSHPLHNLHHRCLLLTTLRCLTTPIAPWVYQYWERVSMPRFPRPIIHCLQNTLTPQALPADRQPSHHSLLSSPPLCIRYGLAVLRLLPVPRLPTCHIPLRRMTRFRSGEGDGEVLAQGADILSRGLERLQVGLSVVLVSPPAVSRMPSSRRGELPEAGSEGSRQAAGHDVCVLVVRTPRFLCLLSKPMTIVSRAPGSVPKQSTARLDKISWQQRS
mmetsp:Transcript_4924/g.10439  ORF Transcript_4924/g.10439 Transcript_4924/m.10439 type:complete len:219 (-) Transcript_4924:326-982(-)